MCKLKKLELPQFPSTEIIASIPGALWFLIGISSLEGTILGEKFAFSGIQSKLSCPHPEHRKTVKLEVS